jgi:hypothetical protein
MSYFLLTRLVNFMILHTLYQIGPTYFNENGQIKKPSIFSHHLHQEFVTCFYKAESKLISKENLGRYYMRSLSMHYHTAKESNHFCGAHGLRNCSDFFIINALKIFLKDKMLVKNHHHAVGYTRLMKENTLIGYD